MDHLGAGGPIRGAGRARLVVGEFGVDGERARHALLRHEAERAAADHFLHLRVRVGSGKAGGHHGGHVGGVLAQRVRQQRERVLQLEHDDLVALGAQLVGGGEQRLAERVLLAPAIDAGHAVLGQHGLVVVELEAVAQGEPPQLAVLAHHVPGDHLRAGFVLAVGAVERVEHHEAMIAGDVGGGPMRVEHGEVGLRHELQQLQASRACPGRGQWPARRCWRRRRWRRSCGVSWLDDPGFAERSCVYGHSTVAGTVSSGPRALAAPARGRIRLRMLALVDWLVGALPGPARRHISAGHIRLLAQLVQFGTVGVGGFPG